MKHLIGTNHHKEVMAVAFCPETGRNLTCEVIHKEMEDAIKSNIEKHIKKAEIDK